MRIEDVSPAHIEEWLARLGASTGMSNRTKIKILTILHGVLKRARRVYRLRYDPMAEIEKPWSGARAGIDVFGPEEVWALVRAAESEQDAAIFLTAAFTGLRRGELVALRWRDVDFARRARPRDRELLGGSAVGAEVG